MTEAELDAIEARANAATEGPWEWRAGFVTMLPSDDDLFERVGGGNAKDEEFVAHARADVPALIAEARRLRATELCDCGHLASRHAGLIDGQCGECDTCRTFWNAVKAERL